MLFRSPTAHTRTCTQSPTAHTYTDARQDPPSSRFLLNTVARLKSHVGSCHRRFTQGQSQDPYRGLPGTPWPPPQPLALALLACSTPFPSPISPQFVLPPQCASCPISDFLSGTSHLPESFNLYPFACLGHRNVCQRRRRLLVPCPSPAAENSAWYLGALSKCLLKDK